MSKKLAKLTLGLLLFAPVWAEEEAAVRVQSISKVSDSAPSKLIQKRPTDKDGYPVSLNSTGYVKDHYITDKNTVAALEFLIGGRVGINRDTDIEIVNERSIADGKTPTKRIKLKSGSLWIKADAKSLKQPVEIQTNGGVMGIKGTEFTVETQPDGSSRVCCFESNSSVGGVEIRDNSGKVVGVAKPGDEYVLNLKTAPVVKHYDNVEEFRQREASGTNFSSMFNSPVGRGITTFAYAMGGGQIVSFAGGAAYTIDALSNVERDPAGASLAALSLANQAGANTGPVGSYVGWGASIYNSTKSNEPPKPDYPSDMMPDASPKSSQANQTVNGYPSFSWKGVEDARSYAVLISRDENLNDIVFSDQTQNQQISYPSSMRPLTAGKYFWRVVPLDEEEKPVQRAGQTFFIVK
ncbi:FecR domain-containing protein [bacterium]|nr:FecR domain-containing protein [bacterium]